MGNTVSCCVSPSGSPKLPRQVERLEEYQINTDLSDDTGPYLQHISDREVPDGKLVCVVAYWENIDYSALLVKINPEHLNY